MCGHLLRLFGVDQFIKTTQTELSGQQTRATNPFSHGIIRNCLDFWGSCSHIFPISKEHKGEAQDDGVMIDYYHLYELPQPSGGRSANTYSAVSMQEDNV